MLFFNAAWCPTCQIAKKNFSENANSIPAGLTLLDVDFDDRTDLRQKHGVTVQHTFVEVDASGNQVRKWNGGYTINQITDQLEI